MPFEFDLGQQVKLIISGEQGYVTGRAEYQEATPSYFIRYRAADGRLTETWWPGSALAAREPVVGIAERPIDGPTDDQAPDDASQAQPSQA